MKPKVLITVLCALERTGWMNPMLSLNLAVMMRDPRFDVAYQPVCDYRPFEYARNRTIDLARSMDADVLLSVDNDNYVEGNPLDVITEMGERQDVVGLSYGVGRAPECVIYPLADHGAIDGNFREEKAVSGGVLYVRSRVWRAIPKGPWFRWQSGNDELLAPHRNTGAMPEDTYFCNLVQQAGFKVWSHRAVLAGHLKTSDVTKIVTTLDKLSGGAWSEKE